MADIQRIKGNIKKMIDGGAQEAEIDQYISMEGVTVDDLSGKYGLEQSQPEKSWFQEAGDYASGVQDKIVSGLTFGLNDEVGAAGTAVGDWIADKITGEQGAPAGQVYDDAMAETGRKRDEFSAQYPVSSVVSEVGGAFVNPVNTKLGEWAVKSPEMLAKVLKGATAGGSAGAAYGFGNADGDMADRAKGTAIGAGVGATVGGLVPPLMSGATKGAQIVKDNIMGRTQAGAGTTAQRKVVEALQRDGLSLRDAEARVAKLGPEAALMDVGPNSQSLARSVYTQPGQGKTQVGDFLKTRQEGVREPVTKELIGGQNNRVSQAVDDLIPNDVRGARAATKAERAAQGGNYEAAKAADDLVDVQPVLASLDDEITKSKGGIKTALQKVRSYLVDDAGNPEITVDTLHQAKMAIDDLMSGEAKTSMGNVAKGRIRSYQDQVIDAIENAGEAGAKYREGRLGTAGAWRIDDALDAGEQFMLKRAGTADDIADALKNMRPEEQEAFRQGAVQAIKTKLGDLNSRTDVTKKLMDIPNLESKVKVAFGDDSTFQKYIGALENERAMFDSYGRIIGGSRTGEVAAEQADSAVDPGRVAEGIRQIVSPNTMADVIRGGTNVIGGVRDKISLPAPVSEQLGEILTGRYTSGLSNMASKTAISDARRQALSRLLTSGGAVGGGNVQ